MMRLQALAPTLAASICLAGCARFGSDDPAPATLVEQVRVIALEHLGAKAHGLDPDRPLLEQGADELDLVEIVMALEEKLHVQIPDEALSGGHEGWPRSLNVRQLAQVVHRQQQKKH